MKNLEKKIYERELISHTGSKIVQEDFESFLEAVDSYTSNLIYLKNGIEIDDLLEKEGIKIIFSDKKNSFMRAKIEIDDKNKHITLYREPLNELALKNRMYGLEILFDIAKVHEYFHLLEFKGLINLDIAKNNNNTIFSQRLNSIKVEIMAHEFVKKNLKLAYSPIILDYLNYAFEEKSILKELPELEELINNIELSKMD